jgi:hypothetical protein
MNGNIRYTHPPCSVSPAEGDTAKETDEMRNFSYRYAESIAACMQRFGYEKK